MITKLEQGYIQVYTGNGKGKTTAAIGQAVRAAGAGLKTYILMFMKDFGYSELESLKYMNEFITIAQVGNDDFVFRKELPSHLQIDKARLALNDAKNKMLKGEYNLVILDEVLVSVYFGLLTVEDILPLMEEKPADVELILTGRYCPSEIIERADLVTEMQEVKHYYRNGILARKGIES